MSKEDIKKLVGIFAATSVLMATIVPVSVLSQIAEAFPDTPVTMVQMLVALPSLISIASNLIVSKFASRVYKRTTVIACTILYIVAGVFPFFVHGSFTVLLIVAALVGFGLGGVQNGVIALIAQCFEGNVQATAMGLLSLFVGIGGLTYTSVSAMLGANGWQYSYLTYLVILVPLVLELFFLPKGELEGKAEKGSRTKVPSEILWICLFGFVLYACNQLFNSSASMLIAERGIGSTAEAGMASSINTIAGMLSGVLIVPFSRFFSKQRMTATFVLETVGIALVFLAQGLPMVCAGSFCMAMAYGLFTPIENQMCAQASPAVGLAFNIALVSGISSLGQALSPVLFSSACPDISATFIAGAVIMALLTVVGGVHFARSAQSVDADAASPKSEEETASNIGGSVA